MCDDQARNVFSQSAPLIHEPLIKTDKRVAASHPSNRTGPQQVPHHLQALSIAV